MTEGKVSTFKEAQVQDQFKVLHSNATQQLVKKGKKQRQNFGE